MRRFFLPIASIGVVLAGSGCVSAVLASKLVQAPNRQVLPKNLDEANIAKLLAKENPELLKKILNYPPITQSWRIAVSSPPAEIEFATVAPAAHDVKVVIDVVRGRSHTQNFKFDLKMDEKVQAEKGTIVLLHGICLTKESMLPWALYLAAAGYRAVLVDLRGHGASTGDHITYGRAEATDLKLVLDHLEKQGFVSGKVGVLGISYGAVVGLHWAARDSRVGAVVALAPFCDPQRAIASFVREVARGPLGLLSPARLDRAIDRAAEEANFSWKEVSVVDAVEKIPFPILFYHGAHDNLLPVWHSAELKNYARAGSRLVVLPDDDHVTLAMRLEPIAAEARAWFDERLGPASPAPIAQ